MGACAVCVVWCVCMCVIYMSVCVYDACEGLVWCEVCLWYVYVCMCMMYVGGCVVCGVWCVCVGICVMCICLCV